MLNYITLRYGKTTLRYRAFERSSLIGLGNRVIGAIGPNRAARAIGLQQSGSWGDRVQSGGQSNRNVIGHIAQSSNRATSAIWHNRASCQTGKCQTAARLDFLSDRPIANRAVGFQTARLLFEYAVWRRSLIMSLGYVRTWMYW